MLKPRIKIRIYRFTWDSIRVPWLYGRYVKIRTNRHSFHFEKPRVEVLDAS